ncbi:Disease resistance RPP13-like protein 4 [Rhynchospora pubera]|uniref:Disease resistance RPP13-like protein 4 n=1 Tax=Rhynchospora pubera TaxID=906938 RepID=A0AAV8HBI2_9POAL|nr:Disease resistance RPP13-like protein 4 [Rhynchospora pubera]
MSTSNHQKEAKLKASIHDFVGPLLKRLNEEVPVNSDMKKIITDVEKIKKHLDRRENWDRELAGFFGQIERQIDSYQKHVTIVRNESNQQHRELAGSSEQIEKQIDSCTDEKQVTIVRKKSNQQNRELSGSSGQIERQIDSCTDQEQVTIVGNESNQQDILKNLTNDLASILNFILKHIDENLISDLKGIMEQMRSMSLMDEDGSDLPQNNPPREPADSSNKGNQNTEGFMEFLECMKSLNPQLRNCLYSLGVFPENSQLKKRLVIYWWMGLGLVPFGENRRRTTEQLGEIFFSDLVDKGVLIPVIRDHNLEVDRFTIKHTIHSQLISACKKKELIKDQLNTERPGVWHIYGGDDYNLKALVNLGEMYLNSEEITKKLDMHVLQLGRWRYIEPEKHDNDERAESEKTKSKDHIEVDKTDFLGEIGKNVTYLSLRGISRIEEIHESIGKLENLIILDLRACHNLEKLPQKPRSTPIQKLKGLFSQERWFKKLTHLDITECYLLDHMPKWICELSNLEVLKGFVVGSGENKSHPCRLQDLSQLEKIRKLSIRITNSTLVTDNFSGLKKLESLRILTITWEESGKTEESVGKNDSGKAEASEENKEFGKSETSRGNEVPKKAEASGGNKESGQPESKVDNKKFGKAKSKKNKDTNQTYYDFPNSLEKLDIRCYPEADATKLRNPAGGLENLKKLYIRGGNLTKIGYTAGWKVEILRLRFLKKLEIDWYKLGNSFSNLKCVEYVDCDALKNFPKNKSCWRMEIDGHLACIETFETPIHTIVSVAEPRVGERVQSSKIYWRSYS